MKNFYLFFVLSFFYCLNICSQNDAHQWGLFGRYSTQNKELASKEMVKGRVVFMGNSITENWYSIHPAFFESNNYIGRGISGQTSYQFLLRFRQDVINLYPEIVVINAATNDIAENTGAYNEDYTFGNIVSMVELSEAYGIKVILTSTLPAACFGWNPSIKDVPLKIKSLNKRIMEYAKGKNIPYVDYYSKLVNQSDGSMISQYTNDGVHPVSEGYLVMEDLINTVIKQLLN